MSDDKSPALSLQPALELQQVTKRFGDRAVLDDVTAVVPRGQTTVLLGPSGTGKSTLLRLAVGLIVPDSGVVNTLGVDVGQASRAALLSLRQRCGMLFQDGALFGSLTVEENVAFPLLHVGRRTPAQAQQRVDEVLALVGLEGTNRRSPAALSGGQRKRVALARAIALEPELVLFDEPTSGLDPQTSAAVDALLIDTQRRTGTTFLVITHDTQSAYAIGDVVGFLKDGKLRAFGRKADVWASADPAVRAFLDREPPTG